jgi:zinc metalloprotease ZmpB
METIFSSQLRAHLTVDDDERIRHILHTEYFPSEADTARRAASDYLGEVAGTFGIPTAQLAYASQPVSFLDPREQEIQYRLLEVKRFFSASTYCYYQTIHNTPVWGGGLTVTLKEGPYRIVHADHRGHYDLEVDLPSQEVIGRIRATFIEINRTSRALLTVSGEEGGATTRTTFAAAFPAARRTPASRARTEKAAWLGRVRIKRGLFYIYLYDPDARQPGTGSAPTGDAAAKLPDAESVDRLPTLPLPPVPRQIQRGRHYLAAEIVFQLGTDPLNWKALVEIETGTILWLRAMTAGQTHGLVFTYDPKTSTGDLTNTPDDSDAILNPLQDDVELLDLSAPVAMTQSLTGSNVTIVDDDLPTVAAPTQPAGNNFNYSARTNDFAAVNAYYHANNVFNVIESLGFNLATYFDTTAFPVHVDHRASLFDPGGIEVNAFCNGDGPGGSSGDGIGLVGFCLSDTTNTAQPLGRSVDKWVHWHEIGGHGILWDHVNSANFGFAHSAGDSLAAFQNDPESLLRALPQRFQYAPFRNWPAGSDRWFNRTIAAGWGWGGAMDTGGYNSEQIIATTMFRVYQALGGDATDVNKRWHASRVGTYLILNAVGKLSPGANANSATDLYNKLVAADADDWTSEGLSGGAYSKVLRWSFEKQNLWGGAPPAVDLYIDDGRGGEYQYQAVHWTNQSVWNRTIADGVYGQQAGVAGVQSHAYVKVKNRGTTNASGTVKLYHCLPGAGLTWPTDFVQAGPAAGLPTGNVLASNGNEVTVGPFDWTPNVNAYGHDCLLAIVETVQDPSNISNFTPTQTIQEWRLVPHDNNVGQRNVQLVPAGPEALGEAFNGAFFMAGNNLNKPAQMKLKVVLPHVLESRGWQLGFVGMRSNTFRLKAGQKRRIELRIATGAHFTPDDIRGVADRTIQVELYANDMLLGGMSYYIDPDMTEPAGGVVRPGSCNDAAQGLLDCLQVRSDRRVKKVRVKKISVDIELDSDCD